MGEGLGGSLTGLACYQSESLWLCVPLDIGLPHFISLIIQTLKCGYLAGIGAVGRGVVLVGVVEVSTGVWVRWCGGWWEETAWVITCERWLKDSSGAAVVVVVTLKCASTRGQLEVMWCAQSRLDQAGAKHRSPDRQDQCCPALCSSRCTLLTLCRTHPTPPLPPTNSWWCSALGVTIS
ncbi:hypothetical protein Hamer_G017525 [Homarus americanus]|uniref:Uncharacterized protein n=1 Tax=Homarus americanus TaxID=6706 RepID=A0A8J5JCM0_HOMAM|nr:hypothetical protein Hamer_G017525 [Homarus americanus]